MDKEKNIKFWKETLSRMPNGDFIIKEKDLDSMIKTIDDLRSKQEK
jgi:hypothetical protein